MLGFLFDKSFLFALRGPKNQIHTFVHNFPPTLHPTSMIIQIIEDGIVSSVSSGNHCNEMASAVMNIPIRRPKAASSGRFMERIEQLPDKNSCSPLALLQVMLKDPEDRQLVEDMLNENSAVTISYSDDIYAGVRTNFDTLTNIFKIKTDL